MSLKNALATRRVLDGALGTQLEELIPRDSPLSVKGLPLWSTKVLLGEPQLITQIHASYLREGATVAITSLYQASLQTLQKHENMTLAQAQGVWGQSVKCVTDAIDAVKPPSKTYVAASVGPYGAYLANGAEYSGDYGDMSVGDLVEFHREMVRYYAEHPDVDCIAFETIPTFTELQAIFKLAQLDIARCSKEFYVAFSCKDSATLADGTPIEKAVAYIVDAIAENATTAKLFVGTGCNCVPLEIVSGFIANVNAATSSLGADPLYLIVYPNYGFAPDLEDGSHYSFKKSSEKWAEAVDQWCQFPNVRLIGGCCSTGPDEVGQVRDILRQHEH